MKSRNRNNNNNATKTKRGKHSRKSSARRQKRGNDIKQLKKTIAEHVEKYISKQKGKENEGMHVDPTISNVVKTFFPTTTADANPIKQDPPLIIRKTTEYLTKLYPTTYSPSNDDNKRETYGKRITKQKDTYENGSKFSFDMLNLDNHLNMLSNTGINLEHAENYNPKFQELYSIEENVSAAHANPPPVTPVSK